MAKTPTPPAAPDQPTDPKDLELADVQEKLRIAEAQLRMQNSRGALDRNSLSHPNAFMAQDGRTLYRYEVDGETIITPKPLEEMQEQDFYDMPITMFSGQSGRLPQNLVVTFKDAHYAGFWFNKKAKDGFRVGVARSLGFVPAKFEDLDSYFLGLNDKDGAVEQYDLVLMKIHKAKLYSKYAEWIAKAKRDGGIQGYKGEAEKSVHGDKSKIAFYHTPQATSEIQGIGKAPNEL